MLYFILNAAAQLVAITGDYDVNTATTGDIKLCRWDFATFADAEAMAVKANALSKVEYIPTDSGPNVSPRYDVIAAPVIGSKVSRSFNGDSYPAGTIVSISKTLKKITASNGMATWDFYRVGQSGTWRNNGTWSMVSGHRFELNPSF